MCRVDLNENGQSIKYAPYIMFSWHAEVFELSIGQGHVRFVMAKYPTVVYFEDGNMQRTLLFLAFTRSGLTHVLVRRSTSM